MRLGIRTAISALVLTSIVVSAVGVHLLWWRTAQQVSQTLANTINDQIVSAVGDELQSVTTEARSSMLAVRTLLAEKVFEPRDARKREVVFRSQLLSQPTISWVAFGWPDGSFFAGHKAGDGVIEMLEITPDRKLRTDRYEFVGNDLQLKNSHVEDTRYSVTDQEWFRTAIETNDELWATFTTHPKGERLAAAFAAPIDIDKKPVGVIAIIIELTRVSNFLSQLTVGKSAGAFILERNGKVVASPDPNANEAVPLKTDHPLFPVAVEAIQNADAYKPGEGEPFHTHVTRDGKAYQAVITPISFPGWSLVTVVPEFGISRTGADDDPEFADRPCGADRDRRIAVGMAGPAPDRCAPDQGGERDQACRAVRPRQGAAASVAADRDRKSLRRDRRHGAGARRVPEIHPGRSGEAADQRRHTARASAARYGR